MKNNKIKAISDKNQKNQKASFKFALSNLQRRDLKTIFDYYDLEGKSFLNNKEVTTILRTLVFELLEEEVKHLLMVCGKIDEEKFYFEDVVRIVETKLAETNEIEGLVNIFQNFIDNSEDSSEKDKYITLYSLKEIIAKVGEEIPDDELKEMIMEANPELRNINNSEYIKINEAST